MNGLSNKQIVYKSSGGGYIYNLEVAVSGVTKNYAVAVMPQFQSGDPVIISRELAKLLANEFNRTLPNMPDNIASLFEQDITPAITALGYTLNLVGAGQNWGGWNATGKIAQILTSLATDKKPDSATLSAAGLSTWFGANGSSSVEAVNTTDLTTTDNPTNNPTTPQNSASKLWDTITKFAKENPIAMVGIVFVIGFLAYMGYQMYKKSQVQSRMQFAKGAELKALKKEYQRLAA